MLGASIVPSLPKSRKATTTPMPRTMPRTIRRPPSRGGGRRDRGPGGRLRLRTLAAARDTPFRRGSSRARLLGRCGDAVEQPPVGFEGGLRRGDQRVRVGVGEVGLDQRAPLGGVVDVGLLVDPEVLVAGPVADPVVGGEALALGLRDRRLAALDRVEADELGEPVVARRSRRRRTPASPRSAPRRPRRRRPRRSRPRGRCGTPPPRRGGAARRARTRARSRRRRR